MESIKNFKIEDVSHHSILVAATSEPAYEMDRTLIAYNWPDWGDYVLIHGNHCSCYDFDETQWFATKYTEEELVKVLLEWRNSGYGSEKLIVDAALAAIGKAG